MISHRNIRQVWVCQLPKQIVDAVVERGRCAPQVLALAAEALKKAQSMDLAVRRHEQIENIRRQKSIESCKNVTPVTEAPRRFWQ